MRRLVVQLIPYRQIDLVENFGLVSHDIYDYLDT